MAYSIEGCVPFLDHEVVELVRNMPVSRKIRGMTEKYVLREVACPFITDTVYKRQKHPFVVPPSTIAPEQSLREMIQDTLRGERFAHFPFFEHQKVAVRRDRLPTMDTTTIMAYGTVLPMMLSTALLQEQFMAAKQPVWA